MITDQQTNFVYFSALLEKKAPVTFKQLASSFDQLGIGYGTLPLTKDLWAVDFMPIQVKEDDFLQFEFDPDYYLGPTYSKLKTDPKLVWDAMNGDSQLLYRKVSLKMDGGNMVRLGNKVIVTTKVFTENKGWAEQNLIDELGTLLGVEQVIVVPQEPGDITGHSDGMVRFINEHTVLVNQYPDTKKYKDFGYNFRWSLRNAGLQLVECPFTAWENKGYVDATGCYINFLEVGNYIFYPVFGQQEDTLAEAVFRHSFPDRELISIDCRDLAKQGGVLNCATWNVLK